MPPWAFFQAPVFAHTALTVELGCTLQETWANKPVAGYEREGSRATA